jgi:hypothetical protein
MIRRAFLQSAAAAVGAMFCDPVPPQLLRWCIAAGDYCGTVTIGDKVIRASRPEGVRVG